MKKKFVEYSGEIGSQAEELGDIEFWKNTTTEEKFVAAWEIIKDHYTYKGKKNELRFCRSIETAGEMES